MFLVRNLRNSDFLQKMSLHEHRWWKVETHWKTGMKVYPAPSGGTKKFLVTMSPGIEALRISDRPNADPTVLVGAP